MRGSGSARRARRPVVAARRSTRSSVPAIGTQLRQRPASSFQQLTQVYWRQSMQKLKASWKASSCAVASAPSSVADRVADRVRQRVLAGQVVLQPTDQTPRLAQRVQARRRAELVARAAAFAE